MNKIRSNQSGIAHVAAIGVVVVVALVGLVGWRVWASKNKATDDAINTSSSNKTTSPETKSSTPSTAAVSNDTKAAAKTPKPVPVPVPPPATKTFNFVDTTGWVKRSSDDGVISILARSSRSYGHCQNASSTLLLSMVYADKTGEYDCGGLKGAVSWRSVGGGIQLLTRIGFGPSEDLWDRGDAKPVAVKLASGDSANRYDYTNTIDGKLYNTVEYTIAHSGKNYTAVMHWESSYNLDSGSDISVDMFDTTVQKTLTINS